MSKLDDDQIQTICNVHEPQLLERMAAYGEGYDFVNLELRLPIDEEDCARVKKVFEARHPRLLLTVFGDIETVSDFEPEEKTWPERMADYAEADAALTESLIGKSGRFTMLDHGELDIGVIPAMAAPAAPMYILEYPDEDARAAMMLGLDDTIEEAPEDVKGNDELVARAVSRSVLDILSLIRHIAREYPVVMLEALDDLEDGEVATYGIPEISRPKPPLSTGGFVIGSSGGIMHGGGGGGGSGHGHSHPVDGPHSHTVMGHDGRLTVSHYVPGEELPDKDDDGSYTW